MHARYEPHYGFVKKIDDSLMYWMKSMHARRRPMSVCLRGRVELNSRGCALERIAPSRYTYAAWILSGVALVLVLLLQLLPALLAGMLVYELVHVLAPLVSTRLSDKRAKIVAVALLSVAVVGATTAAIAWGVVFFRSDAGSISALLTKMAEIVAGSRGTLPDWLVDQMPEDPGDMRLAIAEWFRVHATEVQSMGKEVGRGLVYALIGMIAGALIALHESLPTEPRGPLAVELIAAHRQPRRRIPSRRFRAGPHFADQHALHGSLSDAGPAILRRGSSAEEDAHRRDVSRRTAAGHRQPHLEHRHRDRQPGHSFVVALVSLVFLMVIHKLEYFLNARIIGRHIGRAPGSC